MGTTVAKLLKSEKDLILGAGVEAAGHPDLGMPYGQGKLESDIGIVLDRIDIVVDFSSPSGLEKRVSKSAEAGKGYICGITGLEKQQFDAMQRAGKRIPVVYAPNFSIGVNVLYRFVKEAAELLGPDYDVEVVELHHRAKADAPSGTASRIVELLKQTARNKIVYGRKGQVGSKPIEEVGVHSIRTGDVVGEHTVIFGGPAERLELTHRASSREAFAHGVIAAIKFIKKRNPGFYTMSHVLGLA